MAWSFVSFSVNYLNTKTNFAYEYRDPQILEVADFIKTNQKDYSKIYVTNDPDSPYSWYYFFNNYDPKEVNKALQKQIDGRLEYENIVWDNNRCPKAKAFEEADKEKIDKILVIENGMCSPDLIKGHTQAKIVKEFSYPKETGSTYNGQVNYRVWEYEPIR